MRPPYDVHQSNALPLDHDEDLRELIALAVSALSCGGSTSPTAARRTTTELLTSPYVLLSYSLRAIVLAWHACIDEDDHFLTKLDHLVPLLAQDVHLLTNSSDGGEPATRTAHFAQARAAVVLAILHLPYISVQQAAQPFSQVIQVILQHAALHQSQHQPSTEAESPERSLSALRILLDALNQAADSGHILNLTTATPFEIILHGRVVTRSQDQLDAHDAQSPQESRVRTAMRILTDTTTKPAGMRESRTINELIADLSFQELRFSPAGLAFPALAARNSNIAIQVLAHFCQLTLQSEVQASNDRERHTSITTLPTDLLEELAHGLDPSSLRSLDLVVRLARDSTQLVFSIPWLEVTSTPAQNPQGGVIDGTPPTFPATLGTLTQLVVLGPFLHRCMLRLARAHANLTTRTQTQHGPPSTASPRTPPEAAEEAAREQRIERRVHEALAKLWRCTGVRESAVVRGAVPLLMPSDTRSDKYGKGKTTAEEGTGEGTGTGTARVPLPYRLEPSSLAVDEVGWERELHNFCQLVTALLTSPHNLLATPDNPLTLRADATPPSAGDDLWIHASRTADAVRVELRSFVLEFGRYRAANEVNMLLARTQGGAAA